MTAALLFMVLFAADGGTLPAADPRGFQAKAEKAEIRLGEPFKYAIQIRHDPKERYQLQPDQKLEPFEVGESKCLREPQPAGTDEAVTTCTMSLKLYDLDDHDIPSVEVIAQTETGNKLLTVPGARVKGIGLLDPNAKTEQLELKDIKPPMRVMVPSYRVLWIALAAAALGGLLVAGFIWWRKRLRRAATEVVAPPLPPDERLEKRLRELQAEDLPGKGRKREYFFRLSEAVREYLGARFELNALDLTTEELLAAVRRQSPPGVDQDELARWASHADMVKFAKLDATLADCSGAIQWGYVLLAKTRHRETAPAPEASPGATA